MGSSVAATNDCYATNRPDSGPSGGFLVTKVVIDAKRLAGDPTEHIPMSALEPRLDAHLRVAPGR